MSSRITFVNLKMKVPQINCIFTNVIACVMFGVNSLQENTIVEDKVACDVVEECDQDFQKTFVL